MTTCNDFIKLCMKSSTCVYGVYAPYGKKSCLKVTIFLGHLVKSTYVINLDQIISYHSIPKSYVHAYNRLLNIKQSKQSVFLPKVFSEWSRAVYVPEVDKRWETCSLSWTRRERNRYRYAMSHAKIVSGLPSLKHCHGKVGKYVTRQTLITLRSGPKTLSIADILFTSQAITVW